MIYGHLTSSGRVAIFTHQNPDGDALGSSLGLMGYLDGAGVDSTIFLPSAPPESLAFMLPEGVRERIVVWEADRADGIAAALSGCGLLVGLDFNNPGRIGDLAPYLEGFRGTRILIDHHVAPAVKYFDHVYSRQDVSSTCELLYGILKGAPGVDGDCSRLNALCRTSLLTGMTTDTNNFANSVYPSTLMMASELVAAGTDRDEVIRNLYFCYPLRRIQAQGYILDKMLHITGDGVAYIVLDSATQQRFGLQEGDTEGFVNIPLSINGVRMSIFLKEETAGSKIRVSIRSKKGTSARECALRYFNGGGHELASGGKLTKGVDLPSVDDAAAYIEKCTHEFFSQR